MVVTPTSATFPKIGDRAVGERGAVDAAGNAIDRIGGSLGQGLVAPLVPTLISMDLSDSGISIQETRGWVADQRQRALRGDVGSTFSQVLLVESSYKYLVEFVRLDCCLFLIMYNSLFKPSDERVDTSLSSC